MKIVTVPADQLNEDMAKTIVKIIEAMTLCTLVAYRQVGKVRFDRLFNIAMLATEAYAEETNNKIDAGEIEATPNLIPDYLRSVMFAARDAVEEELKEV
jgi:hypothetical protein